MMARLRSVLADRGPAWIARELGQRILRPRARCFALAAERVAGRRGLEIGGPSELFRPGGPLPLYPLVGALDGCNFARDTTWEGRIEEGATFRFDPSRRPGRQLVAEATQLSGVATGDYQFVLSSHTIEHSASPLAALREWQRVLGELGTLVLVVPHRDATFDHRRPVTPLAHLVEDLERGTGEDDLTHLDEILALHDLARDPGAGDAASFRLRSQRNLANRCLHHHVFDTRRTLEMVDRGGWSILAAEARHPCHIIVVASKPALGQRVDNSRFLEPRAELFRRSPFASDRGACGEGDRSPRVAPGD